MTCSVKTYFVSETDNLIEELLDLNFPIEKYRKQLKKISAKVKNNKVGFATFGEKSNRIRLCVTPKNSVGDHNVTLQRYLSQALPIAFKHDKAYVGIDDVVIDISLDRDFNGKGFNSLDYIEEKLIEQLLTKIKNFFVKYKSVRYKQKEICSGSIKAKVNVKKNALSLDKSRIHQIQRYSKAESILADYAVTVLEYFIHHRSAYIIGGDKLRHSANYSCMYIKKKFVVNTRGVRVSKIYTPPIKRMFVKSGALELYNLLVGILGDLGTKSENGEDGSIHSNLSDLTSFFVSPELIYQYFVYDKLLIDLPKKKVIHEPCISYKVIKSGIVQARPRSNPDIVIDKCDGVLSRWVIDVKWKYPKSFSHIPFNDIAKLQRDTLIHKGTHSALCYPDVPVDMLGRYVQIIEGEKFVFWVCRVQFGK